MSAQITNEGFSDIITNIKNNWKFIELRQQTDLSTDTVLSPARIDLLSSTDVEILASLTSSQTKRYAYFFDTATGIYEIRVLLKGTDSDIKENLTTWKKIKGARLYASTGNSKMEVSYPTPIQFDNDSDELLITMTIKR